MFFVYVKIINKYMNTEFKSLGDFSKKISREQSFRDYIAELRRRAKPLTVEMSFDELIKRIGSLNQKFRYNFFKIILNIPIISIF